jgi:hypothetical protein
LMDSNYIWYTDVSSGFFTFYFLFLRRGGLHFHTSSTSLELLKRIQWIFVGMKYIVVLWIFFNWNCPLGGLKKRGCSKLRGDPCRKSLCATSLKFDYVIKGCLKII